MANSRGTALTLTLRAMFRPVAVVLGLFALVSLPACAGLSASDRSKGTVTVSAAADLVYAFQEIGRLFEEEEGIRVVFNFGSTGQLAQQIERGAPVDLFASANASFVEELERQGLIVPGTKALYARGYLTLWRRADSPLNVQSVQDLVQPAVKRIAMANPDHAPYGVAARQALQAAGLWDAVQSKLITGENVRQALQYAETGNVDVALVALSLSTQVGGRWTLVPQELYQPIDQAMAVVQGTKHEREARAFANFINGPKGRSVMGKFGFVLPGEEVPR